MKIAFLLLIGFCWAWVAQSQVIINEGSYRNFTQITDSYNENPDWVELYNTGEQSVNLNQYSLSDKSDKLQKWFFPPTVIQPKQWLLVYASGLDTGGTGVSLWETAVFDNDLWRWINPDATTGINWMMPEYNDSTWAEGLGGFGFADNDDSTAFEPTQTCVYTRIRFNIADTSQLLAAVLHVDYDDGFVAYLNGVEIARGNISTQTSWDSFADNAIEALMYQGQNPTEYMLDKTLLDDLWVPGENILAVECHNASTTSSDMTLRVFLSFGLSGTTSQFRPTPDWFNLQSGQELHTNFKISGKGETIYLSNAGGHIIDSLALPTRMPFNYSYGSTTDGSKERAVFMSATPGASNTSQTAYTSGSEPAPLASLSGGIYPGTISVELTTTSATAQIRYTLTGQEPTETSALYDNPVSITSTQSLKARCFSTSGKLPSDVVTNTYFIGQKTTPAGILSITINDEHLYGPTGIYDNWSTDWKKPCYIEYYEPNDHQLAFKQNAGIKIDGGAGGSRSQPQHSFRVEPGNGTLGDGDVNYRLIPSKPDRNSYEAFYLRNGSNQYLYFPCKDAIETRCMGQGTNNSYAGYTPVNVYLNGQYWGYYELREKIDADFFKQHDGTNKDSLDLLGVSYWYGGQLRGVEGKDPVGQFTNDYQKFLTLNTDDENFWNRADSLFDMTYYTDYICAESWIANNDWPYNNIKIHRSPETGHRWRFSLVDVEWSLNPNGWTDITFDHISFMKYYDANCQYIHIWQKAMENKKFHDYFINRFADLMNTKWKADKLNAIATEIYDATRPEMPATFERWINAESVEGYMDQFNQAQITMLNQLANRTDYVRDQIQYGFDLPKTVVVNLNVEPADAGYIKISTIIPDTYPWTGTYFDGIPVNIEAIAKPGFVFDHWDSNALLTKVANAHFNDTLTQPVTFLAHFVENSSSGLVTISEINYNSESSIDADDWVEFWNYSPTVSTDISGWTVTDDDSTHIYTFPENTIIGPDERLLLVRDHKSFAYNYPGVAYFSDLPFGLGNKSDAVKLFDYEKNLIAEVNYTDSAPWPLGADGQGRTLELKDPNNSTNDPANWFDGCVGGSPGESYIPCSEPIVFSEINYNSHKDLNTGDWVELRNIGKTTADLSKWKFMDNGDSVGHEYVIPNGTQLAPNAQLVLVQDMEGFSSVYPGVTNKIGPFPFALGNGGEWIRMYDETEKLRLSVRYNDKAPWPLLADGKGYTLELHDSAGLMNDGNNWFSGCYGGSPGEHFSLPCKSVDIEPADIKSATVVYPNPFTDEITIDFGTEQQALIRVYQFTGQLVYSISDNKRLAKINFNNLPSGIYLLNVIYPNNSQETIRVIKQ